MYKLREYGSMIADKVRMDPYAYALKAAVGPDSVVLDIGTATGIHALLAAKFGARKVYAVESNDAIYVARELAIANGFADQIEFIQAVSTEVTLPEKADVVVSDLRGVLPLFGNHIPSIVDARQRHLATGGVLIPRKDRLWVALVEARAAYNEMVKPWGRPYGLNMDFARRIALNSWSDDNSESITKRNLLMEPQEWAVLDYTSITDPNVRNGNIRGKAMRGGTATGLLVWFDAEIGHKLGFSNGPQERRYAEVYGRGFFPLLEPVAVEEGDAITLAIEASFEDAEYDWHWSTCIQEGDHPGQIKVNFKQSTSITGTFEHLPIHDGLLELRPVLGEYGKVDRFVLGQMDGRSTIRQIAELVCDRFPSSFKDLNEACAYVYELSQQVD
ncbi:MAG: methyltransferase domain-containing protein [Chloroflexi bacterium]|jgi:protein arginine N-methyltransferase 1|nr:methyltransferase domain-containing protein [Chloroflexota bacterium]